MITEKRDTDGQVQPVVRIFGIKHYFIHAAVQGTLVGIGIAMLFGHAGLPLAVAIAAWGVKSAIDANHDSENSNREN